jgi:hypothetical protein
MKVCEKKPICVEIFIRSLKHNIFLILRQKISMWFTVRREPKKFENYWSIYRLTIKETETLLALLRFRNYQC